MPCHPDPLDVYCEHQYHITESVGYHWVSFSDTHVRYFKSLFDLCSIEKTNRHLIRCHVFLDFFRLSRMEWNLGAEFRKLL